MAQVTLDYTAGAQETAHAGYAPRGGVMGCRWVLLRTPVALGALENPSSPGCTFEPQQSWVHLRTPIALDVLENPNSPGCNFEPQ